MASFQYCISKQRSTKPLSRLSLSSLLPLLLLLLLQLLLIPISDSFLVAPATTTTKHRVTVTTSKRESSPILLFAETKDNDNDDNTNNNNNNNNKQNDKESINGSTTPTPTTTATESKSMETKPNGTVQGPTTISEQALKTAESTTKATVAAACDLSKELEKDLQAGLKRRKARKNGGDDDDNLTIFQQVSKLLLDWIFIRAVDKAPIRSYLLNRRSYARPSPFASENITTPVAIEDLLPEPTKIRDTFYLSAPAGVLTFCMACIAFPVLANFLVHFIDSSPQVLDEIVSKLVPGISVLYGTFISLTLNILYNRQRFVQDSVAQETSLLSFLLQNLVSLFRQDRKRMIRSGQAAADQVRILIRETRGLEYITIIYADPYTTMLHLIEEEEERLVREHGDFLSKGPVLATCRDTIRELRKFRACRLSDEALALPDTHFYVLGAMTLLILVGYVVSVLPAVEDLGYTPIESTVLFGVLSVIYLLFYCVAKDLNDLYNGVFQLRKGSAASHLLQIKKIVADHPWLKFEVSFERVNREVKCFAPELAELWFESEQTFGSF